MGSGFRRERPEIGQPCRVPGKSGRGHWHVSIVEISPCGRFAKVAHKGKIGPKKPWWVAVGTLTTRRKKPLVATS